MIGPVRAEEKFFPSPAESVPSVNTVVSRAPHTAVGKLFLYSSSTDLGADARHADADLSTQGLLSSASVKDW